MGGPATEWDCGKLALCPEPSCMSQQELQFLCLHTPSGSAALGPTLISVLVGLRPQHSGSGSFWVRSTEERDLFSPCLCVSEARDLIGLSLGHMASWYGWQL